MDAERFDVVVLGYGAAGAAAAITAHDAGASVVVLEKSAADRHTPSTRMSGAMIMTITDAGGGTRYLDACAGGMVPEPVSRAWAERAVALRAWLADKVGGLDLAPTSGPEHRDLPGASAIVTVQPGGTTEKLAAAAGAGPRLWAALDDAVRRRGIPVRYATPAERLVRDDRGRVGAVRARDADGRTVVLGAEAGVVLATGGYEFDEDLKRDNLRAYPAHFYGNPGNTGDGVRMAQAVGASLWHMNQMIGRAVGHFRLDDGEPLNVIIGIAPPGYVITDRSGRRFADEYGQAMLRHDFYYDLLQYDPARKIHPRIPCFWFFDERRRNAGPLTYAHFGAVAVGLYDWSADNSAEIERGWIHQAATIEEVAAAAGVEDPDAAAATVAAYNRACEAGTHDPFGRPPETMVPLDRPPFSCVALWPGGSNTTGGPRRDERSRVLDAFGEPIPGLYAAGELGQPSGLLYPADGSNLSEALCFGQIAVEDALARAGQEGRLPG